MKKIIKVLIAMMLALTVAFSLVACGDEGGEAGDKGLLLKKYAGEDFYTVYGYVDEGLGKTTLDIGAVAGEKEVGRIALNAFDGNDTLVEIVVPDTVTEIQAGAFAKMKKLKKITLPFVGMTAVADSYQNQKDEAENKSVDAKRNFAYIFGTEEYSYGEQITAGYGSGTATYYIPSNLEEVVIAPKGEYNIPMYAFSGLGLVEKITLSGNITEIGEYAFQNCRDLVSINVPQSVKTIYKGAFVGCEMLDDGFKFDADSTLVEIKENAFDGSKIAEIVIPASVKKIGNYCFANSALNKITLAGALESVGAYAFYNCANLSVVDVSQVTGTPTLGVWAFKNCDKLDWTQSLVNLWGAKA